MLSFIFAHLVLAPATSCCGIPRHTAFRFTGCRRTVQTGRCRTCLVHRLVTTCNILSGDYVSTPDVITLTTVLVVPRNSPLFVRVIIRPILYIATVGDNVAQTWRKRQWRGFAAAARTGAGMLACAPLHRGRAKHKTRKTTAQRYHLPDAVLRAALPLRSAPPARHRRAAWTCRHGC